MRLMSALFRKLIPVFAFFLLLTCGALAQQVSGLFVYHTSGQTFLKWKSAGPSVSTYTLYRSRKPLRTSLALSRAEQVFTIRPGQALDRRLGAIIGSPVYFRFPGPAGRLSADEECFVVTVTQAGTWYYAVTAVDKRGEQKQIRPGRNATASGVRERSDRPRPVFQNRLNLDGRAVDVFVHWTSNLDAHDYPAMTNVPCHPFHFAVRKNGRASQHPLLVRMHGRGDNFLSHLQGSGNPQEYLLSLDDYLPGHARSTFWFGYNLGIDIFGRMTPPPQGSVVVDFTRRRVIWTIRWALRELPIDSSRVYLSGASMGGSGAFFTALEAPHLVAAVMAVIPRLKFDVRDSVETPRSRGAHTALDALLGRMDRTPVMIGGERVYDQLDGARKLQYSNIEALPYMRIVAGHRDSTVGWKQVASVLRSADSTRSGIAAFWDERDHDSNGKYTWSPQQDIVSLYRYRANRSWPAFSGVSNNTSPGDSSLLGMMNAAVDWFEPVVDLPDLWSVGIRRASLESREDISIAAGPLTATITPHKLQKFRVRQSAWYRCEIKDGDEVLYTVNVQASSGGMISIPDVPVPEQLVRLELRPIMQ